MNMMRATMAATLTAYLLASDLVAANPLARNCHAFYLDVPVTTQRWTLDIAAVNNDIDVINFALNIDRGSAPNVSSLLTASKPISATYTTYAELCFPAQGKDKKALQILTHGAYFDHRYCTFR
jgi:hypothetical protein